VPAVPFPTLIDSTIRKDLDACGQLANYAHIQHLRPKGKNVHLVFGACFAKGLEIVRKAFYGGSEKFPEPLEFKDALARGARAIILEWGEFVPPASGSGHQKTLDACLDCLLSYFIQWPLAEENIVPKMTSEGPAVEWSFALPIPGIKHPETGEPLLYAGRFDMLAEYNNADFVEDDKTATSLGEYWMNQWKLASQMTGYAWAAKEYGHNIQGVIIRGCAILKRDITFAMVIEQRPQWMIDRWLIQLQHDVKRLIKMWEEDYYDFSLDTSCNNYGGCKYLTLCTSKDPTEWIKTEYEEHHWDPLKRETE